MNRRPVSRKEKAALTRNKLYASAEQLFRQHGFEAVNVDAIVRHAGVSKGSFYVYFESKNFLIATLINDYVKKVDFDYRRYMESLPLNLPAQDIIYALVNKIADVLMENIGITNMRILYKIQLDEESKSNAIIDYNRELYQLFCDVISLGIARHDLQTPYPAEDVARHFVMAFRGLAFEWCVRHPDFDLKEQAQHHFKLLMSGMAGTGQK